MEKLKQSRRRHSETERRQRRRSRFGKLRAQTGQRTASDRTNAVCPARVRSWTSEDAEHALFRFRPKLRRVGSWHRSCQLAQCHEQCSSLFSSLAYSTGPEDHWAPQKRPLRKRKPQTALQKARHKRVCHAVSKPASMLCAPRNRARVKICNNSGDTCAYVMQHAQIRPSSRRYLRVVDSAAAHGGCALILARP